MNISKIDQELIILNTAWAMIDDMVNFSIFRKPDNDLLGISLSPRTAETLRLFNIVVTDFLSPLPKKNSGSSVFELPLPITGSRSSDNTFLFYLKIVGNSPTLNADTAQMIASVEKFAFWLEERSRVERVWFPSIDLEIDLEVERREWIRICGDTLKHNLTRLDRTARKIRRILSEHGRNVSEWHGYAAIPDFCTWFHENLFEYHSSTIAEHLNDIRWSLYSYLEPVTRKLPLTSGSGAHETKIPPEVQHPIAKHSYVEITNRCSSIPFFRSLPSQML